MPGRIVLLVTSPRLPAQLLTAVAWDLVRVHPVFAAAESDQVAALRAAGADVTVLAEPTAQALIDAAGTEGTAIWLAGPQGDPRLARELGLRLAGEPQLAEMELLYGSWDPPGARLLDAVAVMDRLRADDAWKRSQTHQSLARYLLEEAYEAYDAIVADDLDEILANWNAAKKAEAAAYPQRKPSSLAQALVTLAESSRDEDGRAALRAALDFLENRP